MSAMRSERPTGGGRATVLITALRCQYGFAVVTCDSELLRL